MTVLRLRALAVVAALAAVLTTGGVAQAAPSGLGFGPPIFVDRDLAGGEPLVVADHVHPTLIYPSHEGTTHLYRPGVVSGATAVWGVDYRNQVNLWNSTDGGRTWKRVNWAGGFVSPPVSQTGFSDPDLTQDEGGRIYDTGIDLVNDALFSSVDGGRSWTQGTVNCSEGDRPWLAGARTDEDFVATNTTRPGPPVFRSTHPAPAARCRGPPRAGSPARRTGSPPPVTRPATTTTATASSSSPTPAEDWPS